MLKFLFLLLFMPTLGHCFTKGDGAKYELSFHNSPTTTDLNIYISELNDEKIGVEYYFTAPIYLISAPMWRQYILEFEEDNQLQAKETYLMFEKNEQPEKLPNEYLKSKKEVQVNNFIFQKEEDINAVEVGRETVEVPAGIVVATHYHKNLGDKIIDFWIAEEAMPIGLVKFISSGKDMKQNFRIELKNLLKREARAIHPSNAIPLTEETRKLLPNP